MVFSTSQVNNRIGLVLGFNIPPQDEIYTMKKLTSRVLIMSLLLFSASVKTQEKQLTVSFKSLSAHLANDLVLAAYEDCTKRGYHVGVAVVGRDGKLLSFIRSPLAGPHTVDVASAKAYTAATFQTSTTDMMSLKELAFSPGVLLVGGGLPINIGGYFYGAVGVSGAPFDKVIGDLDEACAQAGLAAIDEVLQFGEE